jgi:hypothetical protein
VVKFVGDVGLDRLGSGEIGFSIADIPLVTLGDSTATKRARKLRIDVDGSRETVDCGVEFAAIVLS